MTNVKFDPNGEKLWVDIVMEGFYSIAYAYTLLESDGKTPLSFPDKNGNNVSADDDHFHILNENNPSDALEKYDGRQLFTSFTVLKTKDDFGYTLHVLVLQGNDFKTAKIIGRDTVSSSLGNAAAKREKIFITLKKN